MALEHLKLDHLTLDRPGDALHGLDGGVWVRGLNRLVEEEER